MNIEQFIESISNELDVIKCIDMHDITDEHNKVFRLLEGWVDHTFVHNQRIVFFSSHLPSQLLLNHIQRCLSETGIDNKFVMICIPHNIEDELDAKIRWAFVDLDTTGPLPDDKIYSLKQVAMNVEQFKENISSTFDVIKFIDIHDITDKHSDIFKLLGDFRNYNFSPNERIVFFSSHKPSQLLVNHIQRCLTEEQIDNEFVMICVSHNIEEELSVAHKKYGGTTDATIRWEFVDLHTTGPLPDDKIYSFETMCFVPFTSTKIHVNGDVEVCCKHGDCTSNYNNREERFDNYEPFAVGNVNNETLVEVINNDIYKDLRDQFRQGLKPKGCQNCWNTENLGGSSMRQMLYPKLKMGADLEYFDFDPAGDEFRARHIHITPSNLCNFKCRMCVGESSSAIALEEMKFAKDDKSKQSFKSMIKQLSSIKPAPGKPDIYATVLDPALPHLKSFHLLGGEPVMMPDMPHMLRYILASEYHKNIQIGLNTNGSYWSDEIVDLLLQFNLVDVLLSIDDIKDRFIIQRGSPVPWPDVVNIINKWAKLSSDSVNVIFFPTISIQNVLYLDQLFDFFEQNYPGLTVTTAYLESPTHLSIDHMTQAAKDLVYEKYHNSTHSELKSIAMRVSETEAISGQKFIDEMTKLDLRRKTNFSQAHPEIFEAMLKR